MQIKGKITKGKGRDRKIVEGEWEFVKEWGWFMMV